MSPSLHVLACLEGARHGLLKVPDVGCRLLNAPPMLPESRQNPIKELPRWMEGWMEG